MHGPLGYRSGVGIVLVNSQGLVFAGHRRDGRCPPWQMPQGGIDTSETLERAVFRELNEELGTDRAIAADVFPGWLGYDYPESTTTKRARCFQGQRHRWFLLKFTGSDDDIVVATEHAEFSSWRWMTPDDVVSHVIEFKQDIYRRVMAYFAPRHGLPWRDEGSVPVLPASLCPPDSLHRA
ncbi:RNA pyrophosphohydrolase [Telmatospirillum sp.]|uniref:RNA pyrophosphohydrolase n=1 Tax=Telmatospirillum sp. TaxID=2079197 RepID=UPI0028456D33|nr:RNA pyrophosphohydrolase [Telmatospirillum sp.]MDR3437475.1 RNA pyrophosphohydrolase [Telmatospirillum sp.]